ncbi:Hypothetical predicted protein [Lecanosticta acicola]|uniref:Uncharacterized protein n=1 Tax=Lecanosticta acicola TaxID=111012 RepID=A0AAI8Z094_9PEZI|nr:Hypothetical predicted protein [Lecanosticta acicola]
MERISSYQSYQELPPSYSRATRSPTRRRSSTSAVRRVEFELQICSLDSSRRESWTEPITISLRSDLAWEDYQNTLEGLFRQRSCNKNKSFTWRTSLYFANGRFRQIDSRNWEEVLRQIMSLDSLPPGSKDWPTRLVARSNMMTSSRYEELMDGCAPEAPGWDVNTWKDYMLCGGWCLVPYERESASSGLRAGFQSPERSPSRSRGRSPKRTSTSSHPFTSSSQQRRESPARGRSPTVNIAAQTRRNTEINTRMPFDPRRAPPVRVRDVSAERNMYLSRREQRPREISRRETQGLQSTMAAASAARQSNTLPHPSLRRETQDVQSTMERTTLQGSTREPRRQKSPCHDTEARSQRSGTRGVMRRRPGELEKWDGRGYMPFF